MKPSEQKPSTRVDGILDRKIRQADAEGRRLGKTTIEASTTSGKVTVGIEDADRLGTLVGSVTAERPGGRPGHVVSQAGEIVRRLNYLQEPLAVIEAEERKGRAIVRSAQPRQTAGGREYNEAVLEGGESISIKRYRAEPGARRRQVPSNLSRDALGRLADDLVDILTKD